MKVIRHGPHNDEEEEEEYDSDYNPDAPEGAGEKIGLKEIRALEGDGTSEEEDNAKAEPDA